ARAMPVMPEAPPGLGGGAIAVGVAVSVGLMSAGSVAVLPAGFPAPPVVPGATPAVAVPAMLAVIAVRDAGVGVRDASVDPAGAPVSASSEQATNASARRAISGNNSRM